MEKKIYLSTLVVAGTDILLSDYNDMQPLVDFVRTFPDAGIKLSKNPSQNNGVPAHVSLQDYQTWTQEMKEYWR